MLILYRIFVSKFSKDALPFNSMLKKVSKSDLYSRYKVHTQFFEDLKATLDNLPIRSFPKLFDQPYMIYTDASSYFIRSAI